MHYRFRSYRDLDWDLIVTGLQCLVPQCHSTKLTPSLVFFQVKFLYTEANERKVEDAEQELEKLLPELTDFCNYIRDFFLVTL